MSEDLKAPAADPSAMSTRELDDRLTTTRTAMMTSSDPALQEELNSLLQQRWPGGATEPGPRPSAASPGGSPAPHSPAEFQRQQREIFMEMETVHPGSPRAQELQASLESLLRGQYGEDAAPAPGMPADLATLADRVSFPAGTDELARVGMLSLAASENLPVPQIQAVIQELSHPRPMALADARRALAAEYGDQLPTVLRRADEIHETLPPDLQRTIEARGLFSSPVLIRRLLELGEWRARGRRG